MYPYPYYDYMRFCESEAEKMYPEICKELNPYIERICVREDHVHNPKMYPFPKKETVEEMVDEIYEMYTKDKMYRSPDGGYGQRGLFKSLIWILLLGQLLGRRRRRRPGYGYPGYGYPGYGYPGYGYPDKDYPGYGY